jgi:hypothetical protein
MTAASRSLATALRRARFASGLLPQSYTTRRDTTVAGGVDEVVVGFEEGLRDSCRAGTARCFRPGLAPARGTAGRSG